MIRDKERATLRNCIRDTSLQTLCISMTPYFLPLVRVNFDSKTSDSQIVSSLFSWPIGLAGLVAQTAGYYYAAHHDCSELLLVPVATNVASLVYLSGRGLYRHLSQD